MAQLTEKGLASLEKLRDYFPEATYPSGRPRFSSIKMRQRYILLEVEKSPEFLIRPASILRPDWTKAKDQGLIVETTVEPICVVEGTETSPNPYRGQIETWTQALLGERDTVEILRDRIARGKPGSRDNRDLQRSVEDHQREITALERSLQGHGIDVEKLGSG